MNVTMTAPEVCVNCGYRARWIRVSTVRVNKTTLRKTGSGPDLIAGPERRCRECRFPMWSDTVPYRWQLDPEDRVKVDAYRAKRGWS
jgi:hypothetical protein